MFSKELVQILIKVVTSWQVIFITIALAIFFSIVSHVARLHHRSEFSFYSKQKKEKKVKNVPPSAAELESTDNDELDLEEQE
jgi:hypothetical protein